MSEDFKELSKFLTTHNFTIKHTHTGFIRILCDGEPLIEVNVDKCSEVARILIKEIILEKNKILVQ